MTYQTSESLTLVATSKKGYERSKGHRYERSRGRLKGSIEFLWRTCVVGHVHILHALHHFSPCKGIELRLSPSIVALRVTCVSEVELSAHAVVNATRVKAIALRLEAIATRVEAIAINLVLIHVNKCCCR